MKPLALHPAPLEGETQVAMPPTRSVILARDPFEPFDRANGRYAVITLLGDEAVQAPREDEERTSLGRRGPDLRHMKRTELKPLRRLSGDERERLRKLVSDVRRARTEGDFASREGIHIARR